MFSTFIKIATGRSGYSSLFMLALCLVVLLALFTQHPFFVGAAYVMGIIMGFFIFLTGIVTLSEGYHGKNWPTVTVKEFKCRIDSRSHKGSRTYGPKIECEFEVEGNVYRGVEYDFSGSYGSEGSAKAKLAPLEKLETIEVYYKPSDPTVNVLYPSVEGVHFIRLILGLSISILCYLYWTGVLVIPEQ